MSARRKSISILVPTYNESENVIPLCEAITKEMERSLSAYDYEILFIDNRSTDGTREKLEALCAQDARIKAIFNARNFGQFHSPYYGLCQTTGDCTVLLCADFQDPIEMLPRLVEKWEQGYKIVCAVKKKSKENRFLRFLRSVYYKLIGKMSSVGQIEHFTGFGLYDQSFIRVLRELDDPTPFLRGIVAELGFDRAEIPYEQKRRRAGRTHNNFWTLYDAAMLSFTTYTKAPIRIFTLIGGILLALSLSGCIACLVLFFLNASVGGIWILPVIGLFSSLHMLLLCILGEYVLLLRAKLVRRPLVLEERRINLPPKAISEEGSK